MTGTCRLGMPCVLVSNRTQNKANPHKIRQLAFFDNFCHSLTCSGSPLVCLEKMNVIADKMTKLFADTADTPPLTADMPTLLALFKPPRSLIQLIQNIISALIKVVRAAILCRYLWRLVLAEVQKLFIC